MRLEKSILATLTYYDCFDWPLTSFEIYTRLVKPIKRRVNSQMLIANSFSLREVVFALEQNPYLAEHLSQRNGFWFLKGREGLVAKRIEAIKESEEKLKKLFRYRWVLLGTAFLQGAFVSGSVAGGWAKGASDIDILVVAKKGRIWTCRLFLTLWMNVLGIRRKGNEVADKICLNHYVTDANLEIPFQSLYNAHTYINLIPLVNRQNVFEKFFQKNQWLWQYVCPTLNVGQIGKSDEYVYQFSIRRFFERWMEEIDRGVDEFVLSGFLGDMLERIARRVQLYFIKKNPLAGKPGGRIQAGDFQLEFHPQSKEQSILERYNKKLQTFGLKEFYPEKDSGLK